jgi:hypothetical protein
MDAGRTTDERGRLGRETEEHQPLYLVLYYIMRDRVGRDELTDRKTSGC